jgi:hypothetical protein
MKPETGISMKKTLLKKLFNKVFRYGLKVDGLEEGIRTFV